GLYPHAFGGDAEDPLKVNLAETFRFFNLLDELKIKLVCVSAGSPYFKPHIQPPPLFLPSDAYHPPAKPLARAARHNDVTGELKARYPQTLIVGSGYTYLQDWLPNVGQYYVRAGKVDFVGLGRMVLAYPDLPLDVIKGVRLRTKRLCRTFSDCTTAPRNGLVSGCYPLDPFYKESPQAEQLKVLKQKLK